MLIFIENTPRTYAWGSRNALAEMLGKLPTGEPQAELWLGAHPDSPSTVAKATPAKQTLIDLIESDPERYGVDGGPLPFLMKVLAIGAPLSLQVHPNLDQAAAGFAAEDAAGVPLGARERNYGDSNHKPELLVALSEVNALSGFRPLQLVREDLLGCVAAATNAELEASALVAIADRLSGATDEAGEAATRHEFLAWVFSDDPIVTSALAELAALLGASDTQRGTNIDPGLDALDQDRLVALRALVETHPGDPGILVSLLLHLVRLAPGEAIYLGARQLHAYLGGIAVEVMAASDNVLRAGLTEKHVDIAELCRVVETGVLEEPRFAELRLARGLTAWRPPVSDFQLLRARVCDVEEGESAGSCPSDGAPLVEVTSAHPIVLIATRGRVRVERPDAELAEVANVAKGQSLYISAGGPIELTGHGEVFLAMVGE